MAREKPWWKTAPEPAPPPPEAARATSTEAASAPDPGPPALADLADGESTTMQGSGRDPYVLKNVGGVYSCSCPAWRNAGGAIDNRTCKHLRKLRGDAAETHRVGTSNTRARAAAVTRTGGSATASGVAPPVLLAHPWDNVTDLTSWWMSEKLDGVRAYWDGTRLLSRLGNEFFAPDWFIEKLPSHPMDGELWGGRKNFQKTVSTVRRQDRSDAWREVKYVLFDLPALREPFEARQAELQRLVAELAVDHVSAHEQARCENVDSLRAELARVEALGGEGLMMRRPASLYESGRSHTLLKVKSFFDAEARVVGHLPGAGKHKGRLGALECEMEDGTRFSAGTGLSDEERNNPPPIGSIITYRYQELSNDGVPRFPSYVGIRDDVTFTSRPRRATEPRANAAPAPPAASAPRASRTTAQAATNARPEPAAAPVEEAGPLFRRFERDGVSWEISLDGKVNRVRRVLTGGGLETSESRFPSIVAAWRDADRKVREKLEAGYTEVDDS